MATTAVDQQQTTTNVPTVDGKATVDGNTAPHDDLAPNETIYIHNLNEKIKVPELKKQLYNMFSQFGPIIDVIASRMVRTRGQAWIVFQDKQTAALAKSKMDGAIFYDKPMRIEFAKTKSDAIAKLDGTYHRQKEEREERRRQFQKQRKRGAQEAAAESEERPSKRQKTKEPGAITGPAAAQRNMSMNEPNKILFIENLPTDISHEKQMVQLLFQNFAGFKELRIIPSKGLAFAEYENEYQAGVALNELQGYKIREQPMKITFAKK
jgi:RNA recognition motif-containing protein